MLSISEKRNHEAAQIEFEMLLTGGVYYWDRLKRLSIGLDPKRIAYICPACEKPNFWTNWQSMKLEEVRRQGVCVETCNDLCYIFPHY